MPNKEQFKYILLAMGLGLVIYYLGDINRKKHLSPYSGGQQGAVIYKKGFKEYKKGFVTVRQILSRPEDYTKMLKVQGVVGPTFSKYSIFFLSDIDCKNCGLAANKGAEKPGVCKSGKAGCCKGRLPVKLKEVIGKMPATGDIVAAFGRIGPDKGGKLVVLARKIRKLGTLGKRVKPCCQPKSEAQASLKAGVKQGAYSVKTIAENPYSFTGTIKVKGITKGVYPEKSMFGLADCRTRQTGGGCGGALIPVKYTGSPPSGNQCLIVTGVVKATENGKLYLAASEINQLDSAKCQPSSQRI